MMHAPQPGHGPDEEVVLFVRAADPDTVLEDCLDLDLTRSENLVLPEILPRLRGMTEHEDLVRVLAITVPFLRQANMSTEDHRARLRRQQRGKAFGHVELLLLGEQMEE